MLQKCPEIAGIAKVTQVQFIYLKPVTRLRWESVKTAASEAEKLRNIQQKVDASQVRLSQEQPSDEDEHPQNSTAFVDGHRAAVQEKDTAHVKQKEKKKKIKRRGKKEK